MMIAIFFWWIGLSIVVAVAANTRGRSPIAWFIYAIIFSPLLSGLLLLALPAIGVAASANAEGWHCRLSHESQESEPGN